MAKSVKQFALSHELGYELIHSFYAGSLLDGGGTSCQNCGKLITSVAVVRDSNGQQYSIGMDCAATLSGLTNSVPFAQAQRAVDFAKKLRAALKRFFAEFTSAEQLAAYTPTAVVTVGEKQVYISTTEQCQYIPGKRKDRNTYTVPTEFWESHILPMSREFIAPGAPAASVPAAAVGAA